LAFTEVVERDLAIAVFEREATGVEGLGSLRGAVEAKGAILFAVTRVTGSLEMDSGSLRWRRAAFSALYSFLRSLCRCFLVFGLSSPVVDGVFVDGAVVSEEVFGTAAGGKAVAGGAMVGGVVVGTTSAALDSMRAGSDAGSCFIGEV